MRPLSLAAGTLPEFEPDVVARAAGEAGYHRVGLTVQPQQWNATLARRVSQALTDWQLSVLDVEVVWIPAGAALSDDHRRLVDIAGELSAANLLVVSQEADLRRAGAALHQLCEWAEPYGVRIALEFLMLTPIRTPAQALAVIEACGHPAAALLVDALHLARAGARPEDLAAVDPALISYVQLCDGRAHCDATPEAYLADAVDLRSAPGEGELPLAALLEQIPVEVPLSLEVRSRRYRQEFPDAVERARVIRERTEASLRAR